MMTTVRDVLAQRSPKRVVLNREPYPKKLLIEDHALKKAHEICVRVREHCGGPREWYGYLMAREADLRVVVDILLERNDEMSRHYTRISGKAIAQAADRARGAQGRIVGGIHSHAASYVFFSHVDDRNIAQVVSSVSLDTAKLTAREELLDPLVVDMGGEAHTEGAALCVQLDVQPGTSVAGARLLAPVFTGWSYNLVINDRRETDAEVAVLEEHPLLRRTNTLREVVQVEVLKTGRNLDQAAMDPMSELGW